MAHGKKKMRKEHKKMSHKGKKITAGAASVLLGAGIATGANVRPVKASGYREDEITEVENAEILGSEKTKVKVEQRSTDTVQNTQVDQNATQETQNNVENVQVTQETAQSVEGTQDTSQADNAVQNTVQNESEAAITAQSVGATQEVAPAGNEVQTNSTNDVQASENIAQPATTSNVNTAESSSYAGGMADTGESVKQETTVAAKAAVEDNTATITPDSQDQIDKVKEVNAEELARLQQEIEKIAADYAKDIVVNDPSITHVTAKNDLDSIIQNLKSYNDDQIAKISSAIDKYKADMEAYTQEKAAYDAFLAELEKYGLYKKGDTDPATLNQGLKFGEEQNAKVDVKIENDSTVTVTERVWDQWHWTYVDKVVPAIEDGSAVRDSGRDFLNYFYRIRTEATQLDGPLITLTYTGLENTSYGNTKIDKMVITFSDWKYNSNYGNNANSEPGIYFSNDPTKGFWYIKSDGVTMEMQLYSGDKVVTLGNDAYVVTGSMNSEGGTSKYIEKAQIINNGQEYGGNGISLPESEVTVHKDPNGGGDILYSEKNINFFDDLSSGNVDDLKKTAEEIWGKEAGDFRIDNYLGWDATPEELAKLSEEDQAKYSARKIYGTGLFKVFGDRIKIRFSNAIGSGWSTYSSDIPSLTRTEPEKPELSYTPGQIVLDQSSVTIHYMDVNGMNKSDIKKGSGTELKYQSFGDLIVDGQYSISNLWDWTKDHYVLVTKDSELDIDSIITVSKDHMDLYVYLEHETKDTTRTKEVNQLIEYRYQTVDGEKLKGDYIDKLIFTQTGKHDLVDNVDIWDSDWQETKEFGRVTNNYIFGHYHLADRENDEIIEAISKTVTNDNFDKNLDVKRIVIYVDNVMGETERENTIKHIIHYKADDGTDLGQPDSEVIITFTQKGQIDTLTGEKIWDENWTETITFEGVTSPETIKRYHLKNEKDQVVGPMEVKVTGNDFEKPIVKEDTVYYTANTLTDIERTQEIEQVIHYVARDGEDLGKEDHTATLTFTQKGKYDETLKEEIWDPEWSTTITFDGVESDEVIGRYHLEDKNKDSVVGPMEITVNTDAFAEKYKIEYTVYYTKNNIENTERSNTIKHIIHYKADDGTDLGQPDSEVIITFTQKGQIDTTTGEYIWDEGWTENITFEGVVSPETIKRYHLKNEKDQVVGPMNVKVTANDFKEEIVKEDTVYYTANTLTDIERTQEIEQVIHYVARDGEDLGKEDHTATLTFTQKGKYDETLKEEIWDPEWSTTITFDGVESDEIIGHYHLEDKNKDSVVGPMEITVNTDAFAEKYKVEYTVYYVHNVMEDTERNNTIKHIIHYKADDGTDLGQPDSEVIITFTQKGQIDTLTGEYIWNEDWTENITFEGVTSPETIKRYHLKDEKDKVVGPMNVKVTANDFKEEIVKEDTVYYTANTLTDIERTQEIEQVIHYVARDGEDLGKEDYTATLTFTQKGKYDETLKEEIWDPEWSTTITFDGVESDEVIGRYHLEDKNKDSVVGPMEVTVNTDAFAEKKKVEYTVYYVHNVMENTSRVKDILQTIHYVAEDGTDLGYPDYTKTLTFEQKGQYDSYTKEFIWDGEWTPTQTFEAVESPEVIGHYHLKDKENDSVVKAIEKTVTNENVDTVLNEERTILYVANAMVATDRTKVVEQVIHYVYEDGTKAAEDHVVKLEFVQTGIKDTVTGEEIWNGEWTPTQTFETVVSPVIDGYTADKKEVEGYDVTVNNDNFDENQDREETVTYKKNTVDPGTDDPDNPDPTPTPDPDPEPTPTPDPEPTPNPDPDDPYSEDPATPPLPEDELGEYPSQSDEDEDEVPPHGENKPGGSRNSGNAGGTGNTGNSGVTPLENAVRDDSATPENVSTGTTDETEGSQTTVNSTSEETLPETGEDESKTATIFSMLAAALGLTGLAATSRRRKATVKRSRKDKKNGK